MVGVCKKQTPFRRKKSRGVTLLCPPLPFPIPAIPYVPTSAQQEQVVFCRQICIRSSVFFTHRRLMFWIDLNSRIMRSTLNGTNLTSLVTYLNLAQSIDLDRRNKLVFWADSATNSIGSVHYYGNNTRLLYRYRNWALGYLSFFGIAFYSSDIFITDPARRMVFKVNTSNETSPTYIPVMNYQPMGLVLYDKSRQLPGKY